MSGGRNKIIFIKDEETIEIINKLAKKSGLRPREIVRVALAKLAKEKGIVPDVSPKPVSALIIRDPIFVELADRLKEETNLKTRIDIVRIALSHLQEIFG